MALLFYGVGSIALFFWADESTKLTFRVALLTVLIGAATVFLAKCFTTRESARQQGSVAANLIGLACIHLAGFAGSDWAPYLELSAVVLIATAALLMPAAFWKQPIRLWHRPAAELPAARDVRSDS